MSANSHRDENSIITLMIIRIFLEIDQFPTPKHQHRVATVREKSGKNEHFSRSGKLFDIVKVSERSENSVFQFIVHKFSSRLRKQARRSI